MNKIEALLLSIGLIFVIIGFFYKVFFPIFFICIGLIFLKRSIKKFTDKNVKKGNRNIYIKTIIIICIRFIILKRRIIEFNNNNVKKRILNLFITIVFLIGMIISYINI